MTPLMIELLRGIRRSEARAEERGMIASLTHWNELSNGEKNAARALVDRGYITYGDRNEIRQTEAGKAVEL